MVVEFYESKVTWHKQVSVKWKKETNNNAAHTNPHQRKRKNANFKQPTPKNT